MIRQGRCNALQQREMANPDTACRGTHPEGRGSQVDEQSPTIEKAQAILAGTSGPDGPDIAGLDKMLSREGARELVRQLLSRELP
jgi:hypothetical protein